MDMIGYSTMGGSTAVGWTTVKIERSEELVVVVCTPSPARVEGSHRRESLSRPVPAFGKTKILSVCRVAVSVSS